MDFYGLPPVPENEVDQLAIEMRAYDMVELDPKILREMGNSSFKKADYWKAISYYTKSLVRSPAESRLRGLAYANRSAVLLNLGLYEESVQDALTALQNDYPSELTHKLYFRMGMCKNAMGKRNEAEEDFQTALGLVKAHYALEPEKEIEARDEIMKKASQKQKLLGPKIEAEYFEPPPLSFGPHPDDSMVSAALIYKAGIGFIANRNLEIGDVLMMDNPLIFEVNCVDKVGETRWIYCNECMKMCLNLMPCLTCSWMCYCSEVCRKSAWEKYHKNECVARETLFRRLIKENNNFIPIAYRTINFSFQLVSVFGLENCCKTFRNSEIIESAPDQIKKYFNLEMSVIGANSVACCDMDGIQLVADSYGLSGQDKIHFVFFMERAVQIAMGHWQPIFDTTIAFPLNMASFKHQDVAYGIHMRAANIRYSCDPNTCTTFYRKTLVLRARRPIREGEEIFRSTGIDYCRHPIDMRQEFWAMYSFDCKCAACVGKWPLLDEQVLCHKFISSNSLLKPLYEQFKRKIEIPCMLSHNISVFTPENYETCLKIHELYRDKKRRDDRVYNKSLDFIVNYFRSLSKRFVIDSATDELQKPNRCIPITLAPPQQVNY